MTHLLTIIGVQSYAHEGASLSWESVPVPRRRVARLSLIAAILGGAMLGLLGLAAWIALGEDSGSEVGRLPLGVDYDVPAVSLLLAALVGAAALFVGFAALQTAAAMRVLARDRRIPAPLPEEARRIRSRILSPIGVSLLQLDREPQVRPPRCRILPRTAKLPFA